MNRHWYLDWTGPRPERELNAAAEAVLRDREAAERRAEAAAAEAEGAAEQDGAGPVSEDGEAAESAQRRRAGETA